MLLATNKMEPLHFKELERTRLISLRELSQNAAQLKVLRKRPATPALSLPLSRSVVRVLLLKDCELPFPLRSNLHVP